MRESVERRAKGCGNRSNWLVRGRAVQFNSQSVERVCGASVFSQSGLESYEGSYWGVRTGRAEPGQSGRTSP